MKTPSFVSRVLGFLAVISGFALITPLSAQVSYTYTAPPPPGYPAAGTPSKQTSTRATRQSAAAVQPPATSYPAYPGSYPPPPGYTYPPPPGYGTTQAPKPTSKPATTSKAPVSSKKPAAGPPPPPTKVYGPTGDLSTQVAKLRDSDKVQNLRIGELERDVSSIKRGGKSSGATYDGGNDLAAHTTYVARPGDTLFRIASTHRVSVGEIQQLNRMTEDEVRVGQTLLIPSPHRLSSPVTQASYKPATPGNSAPATMTTTTPLYYTVKKGDSLKAIALKHKMATSALASANKIKDVNKIVVGQRLKIPGRTVTVASRSPAPARESNDTVPLPGFGMSDPLPPPPATGLTPAPAPAAASAKPPVVDDSHRGILAYRVDRSDTIESIATQFSTTPARIREINRLDASTPLKPGDEIMVPAMGAVSVSSR
jgi:LysM repeat protein